MSSDRPPAKRRKIAAAPPAEMPAEAQPAGSKLAAAPQFFLMKAEPGTAEGELSIDALNAMPQRVLPNGTQMASKTMFWDGVRNYSARNNLRNMRVGDLCYFYHSNCKPPGIVGLVRVVREAYPDFAAFDPKSKYFDPKSKRENPTWVMVDVECMEIFPKMITLPELRGHESGALAGMELFKQTRLSVSKVTPSQFAFIRTLVDGL